MSERKRLKKGLGINRLYTLDAASLARLEILCIQTGHNKSRIVREALMQYEPRSAEELRVEAANMMATVRRKTGGFALHHSTEEHPYPVEAANVKDNPED